MSRQRKTASRLSLAWRDLTEINPRIAEKFAATLVELDLSNNKIVNVDGLRDFKRLETLVLDNNLVNSHSRFPQLPNLSTLWVNKNNIKNLSIFIDKLVEALPNLKYLSMLHNDACPNFFNGGSLKQYNDYRCYVISRLRGLTQLDAQPVTDQERRESLRLYGDLTNSVAFEKAEKEREEELYKQRELEKLEQEREEAERRRAARLKKREEKKRIAKQKRERERKREMAKLRKEEALQKKRNKTNNSGNSSSTSNDATSGAEGTMDDMMAVLLPSVDALEIDDLPPSFENDGNDVPFNLTDSDDWSSDELEDGDDDDFDGDDDGLVGANKSNLLETEFEEEDEEEDWDEEI